jgi:hypothetical protein
VIKEGKILLAQADKNGLIYVCFYDDRPAIAPRSSSLFTEHLYFATGAP